MDQHHRMEEEWIMESLKGAVKVEDIVHEHDGFRQQFHALESYLITCLPAGTMWGFENSVVPSTSTAETFRAERLEQLIETLVAVFLDHVSVLMALLHFQTVTEYGLFSYVVLCRAWLS